MQSPTRTTRNKEKYIWKALKWGCGEKWKTLVGRKGQQMRRAWENKG